MEERLLDKIAEPFNLQLPEYKNMEVMIDALLPTVGRFSEASLEEESSPLYTTSWVKMSDKPGYTAIALHEFQGYGGGEIRVITDGEVSSQAYEVSGPRRIIMGDAIHRGSLMYELAFLDNDFLILKRHGNPDNIKKKYLFFCREAIGTRLVWHEALERLVDKYRNSQFPLIGVALVIAIIIAVMLYLR